MAANPSTVSDILSQAIQQQKPGSTWMQKVGIFTSDDKVSIRMPGYTVYMNEGRGPGKRPPMEALTVWMREKGIAESMYWAIANKIAKEGTEGIGDKWLKDAVKSIAAGPVKEDLRDKISKALK